VVIVFAEPVDHIPERLLLGNTSYATSSRSVSLGPGSPELTCIVYLGDALMSFNVFAPVRFRFQEGDGQLSVEMKVETGCTGFRNTKGMSAATSRNKNKVNVDI